ncbi:RloB family protein [Prevotella sp. OH937_COT-195]|uniref:RloB family protein n=1 Tax=Prevotella sp. OH937_COT-195 TaxID=2491051 RepID=UPI000F64F985|nr:RloB domain-containing protein [Prevotella sp. OH937_COT-195]
MAKRQKKDHRLSDLSRRQGVREIKQSFLIVCEGEKTEPDYFKAFRMTAATIKAVGQAMNTMTLVNKAINIREADQKRKRVYDQCWVVFDKDDFLAKDFNQAILLAEKNGFHVAYSNQAFEYWFLLHYNLYTGTIHRNQYKDMLTRLTGMPYSKSEGYGAVMYNLLLSRQQQAISNAETVLAEISHGNPAEEESSTTVQRLVSELNKYL